MAVVIRGASVRMPPSDPITPPGHVIQRKSNNVPKKRSSGAPAPNGFTFVDQSADLRSIADKKIVDSDQRHLIRSHVMQKVRKDERMQGKKRPTGRDAPRKPMCSPSTSTILTATASSTPQSSGSPSVMTPIDLETSSPAIATSPSSIVQCQSVMKMPRSPSQGRLDPFGTLPGGPDLSRSINELTAYCFHTFIPMTFPVESCSRLEYDMWRVKVLQSQSANTATFFGLMAIVAAHRTIKNGRHRDLRPSASQHRTTELLIDNDFAEMKNQALLATQARIKRNGWDAPTVEAIFSLIGAEQILGNFDEAHTHLSALKQFFIDGREIDPTGPASTWIPLTDVKGAIGTMSRPLFRLPWTPEPVPQEMLNKLHRWQAPEISALGTGFTYVEALSPHLQNILQDAAVLFKLCQFNALRSQSVSPDDFEVFRKKNLELEYDVLSYIYPGSPTDDSQSPDNINDYEQITRVAILGMTSTIITKVLPSAGVGRALTHHQSIAMQKYYANNVPSRFMARFITWALMIFAQCALGQQEERYFTQSIAHFSQCGGIDDWTTLETVCGSFLYVPTFQRSFWQAIWRKACTFRQIDGRAQITLAARSRPQQVALQPQGNTGFS